MILISECGLLCHLLFHNKNNNQKINKNLKTRFFKKEYRI